MATNLIYHAKPLGGGKPVQIPYIGSGYNYTANKDGGCLLIIKTEFFKKLLIGGAQFSQSNNMGIKVSGRKNNVDTQIALYKNTTSAQTSFDIDKYDSIIFTLIQGVSSSETCALKDVVIR